LWTCLYLVHKGALPCIHGPEDYTRRLPKYIFKIRDLYYFRYLWPRELFPYLQGFKQQATSPDTIEYKTGEIFGEIKNKFQSGYSLRDALEYMNALHFRSQKKKHELSVLYED
jgi:hypothetical protein